MERLLGRPPKAEELEYLTLLTRIGRCLNAPVQLEEGLGQAIDLIMHALDAERGCIMIDRGGEYPDVIAIRGAAEVPVGLADFPFSRSVVTRVLEGGPPVVTADVERECCTESLMLLGTRTVMCVPLVCEERTVGLLYLDNATSARIYTAADLQLLGILADMISSAVQRARCLEMLVQNDKVAAMGTMVAGIVHELNNPLTALSMVTSAITLMCPDPELPQIMESEIRRCQDLVKRLLRVAHPQNAEQDRLELAPLVRDVTRLVRAHAMSRGVQLLEDLPHPSPRVRGNRDQLVQILLNLLNNAVDASAGVPPPAVTVRLRSLGGRVRLTVEENGTGIAPQNLRRIFDPFFTTKPPGHGTGLGLSLVTQLVRQHQGQITAHNLPAGGACFCLELPLESGQP